MKTLFFENILGTAFIYPSSITHEYQLYTNSKQFLLAEVPSANLMYLCISLHTVILCGENI